jgi:predicted oxidoreductase
VLEWYLDELGTDYVDFLLLHREDYLMDYEDVAQTFRRFQSEGKVRHFGASNFQRSTYELLDSKFSLVTNQIEVSVRNWSAIRDGTLAFHQQKNTSVLAWGALGGDAWVNLPRPYLLIC